LHETLRRAFGIERYRAALDHLGPLIPLLPTSANQDSKTQQGAEFYEGRFHGTLR
jgi:hypothetical protein